MPTPPETEQSTPQLGLEDTDSSTESAETATPGSSSMTASPRYAIHPQTGEILELDRPTSELSGFLEWAKDQRSRMREAEGIIGRELLERMDKRSSWTLHDGDFTVVGKSPKPEEDYDGQELFDLLGRLHQEGKLDEEAVENAVEVGMFFKPKKNGINQLRKRPDIAAELDKIVNYIEKDRPTPTVKRKR